MASRRFIRWCEAEILGLYADSTKAHKPLAMMYGRRRRSQKMRWIEVCMGLHVTARRGRSVEFSVQPEPSLLYNKKCDTYPILLLLRWKLAISQETNITDTLVYDITVILCYRRLYHVVAGAGPYGKHMIKLLSALLVLSP